MCILDLLVGLLSRGSFKPIVDPRRIQFIATPIHSINISGSNSMPPQFPDPIYRHPNNQYNYSCIWEYLTTVQDN